jgi:hypothetical protein
MYEQVQVRFVINPRWDISNPANPVNSRLRSRASSFQASLVEQVIHLGLAHEVVQTVFCCKRTNAGLMMSNTAGSAKPQPSPPHEAIRALLRSGRNDEAIVQLCALQITQPNDLVAKELLFDAFFQKRD